MQAVKEKHFLDTDEFTADQGFNIAVGFVDYFNLTMPLLDPSYGKLELIRHQWSANEFLTMTLLPSHICSAEELGLEGNNAKYMKPRKEN